MHSDVPRQATSAGTVRLMIRDTLPVGWRSVEGRAGAGFELSAFNGDEHDESGSYFFDGVAGCDCLRFAQMNTDAALRDRLKGLVVETLMLQVPAAEIRDDQPLFGPDSLGLDSVDALQLVVMLDKHFGLKVSDAEVARQVLKSIGSMAVAVATHQSSQAPA